MGDLAGLPLGNAGYVTDIAAMDGMKRRLMDLGFTEGARVEALLCAPFGGMRAYRVRGTVIALRRRDAGSVNLREERHG